MNTTLLGLIIIFLVSGSLFADSNELLTNTKPVAVLTSTPNQTWFYNMEDVVFSSTNSYDTDGYVNYTRFFINGDQEGSVSYMGAFTRCFALYGSLAGDCYQLSQGATTVTVGFQVRDNQGEWSSITSNTYTIQQHKGRKYFITDHIGNVRATVNRDGNVLGYDDYYPFGKVMRSNNNANPNDNYKFTGHERDDEASLSIDYMNARTYDPITGVFMQRDPLEDQFPGWTPYHYVHNNPLNLVDPTGMRSTRHASETEDERKTRKVGAEPKGSGWGAVWANLFDGGSVISMTRSNRLDPSVSEQHGYNSTVNEATEKYKPEQNQKNTVQSGPSIRYNDRQLNPDGYVINNVKVILGVLGLYGGLVDKIGHEDFDYQVTGGDRYVGGVGIPLDGNDEFDMRSYSSTNHDFINRNTGSSHVLGIGVDVRIKWFTGKYISVNIVSPVIRYYTNFILVDGNYPKDYPNSNHYHLKLRN